MKRSPFRSIGIYIIILLVIWGAWSYVSSKGAITGNYSYDQFKTALQKEEVADVRISQNREVPTGTVTAILKDDEQKRFNVSDVNEFQDYLEAQDYDAYIVSDVPGTNWMVYIIPGIIQGLILVVVLMLFMNAQANAGGGGNKMMNFGKSRAKMTTGDNVNVNFGSVAGLKEEKEDLEEMVDFLRDPQKYTKLGARIPKGLILVGPPGTGKTLLAKAVAGEAGVPFFSISGSDFVEMFVGVGASRVRDLFEDAKKHAPCIVFIDEIDAVARRRGTGMGGGHDEREQTLNQLLVEMDGFGVNMGIIVMAATNRVDILDPAIMRPGRFDRKVYVGRPDVGPVYSVSIIPTGAGAAGYTMPLPEKDEMFNTKGRMLQEIVVDLGGRVAEELVFDDITTGASQDIKQATALAKAMVTKYGMSENLGLINYDDNEDGEVFLGRDLGHTRGYGESVATVIDQEIKRIIDECYEKARTIIGENRDVLESCAQLLLEKEKISRNEFEALFEKENGVE